MEKKKRKVVTDFGTYEERNLAQLIRRRMMSKEYKDKTKYTRKLKHKKERGVKSPFLLLSHQFLTSETF